MEKSKSAVIFDLDGVLLSTDRFHYLAWKAIADTLSIPFDEAVNNRLRGVSRMESLNIILSYSDLTFTQEEKEELAEKKNSIYRSYLEEMSPNDVSDDVRRTLYELRKRGIPLAIGSGSKNTGFILDKTGLRDSFDAIVDGTMITKAKPDPEVFLKAAGLLHYPYGSCYVVEDSFAGIEAAYHGGFHPVGIGDAKHSPYTEFTLDRLADLLRIVEA